MYFQVNNRISNLIIQVISNLMFLSYVSKLSRQLGVVDWNLFFCKLMKIMKSNLLLYFHHGNHMIGRQPLFSAFFHDRGETITVATVAIDHVIHVIK